MRLLLLLVLLLTPGLAAAQEEVIFGYLGLKKDPRYARLKTYANLVLRPAIDPVDGAMTAMRDARIVGRALKMTFTLEVTRERDPQALRAAFERLYAERGARFFLVDLPGDLLAPFAAGLRDREVLLFNISATDPELRGEQCQGNLLHVIPSRDQLMDGLAQFLAQKQWRKVLLLVGPREEDARLAESFVTSLRRFGGKVVDRRDFLPTNDPRARERNNIRLLTSGVDYDAIFVADSRTEFGRFIPYNAYLPRPVVGSVGLVPSAWHWASERFGSPQLNQRFERQVKGKRRMSDVDWAAWAAVRSLLEAITRTRSAELAAVREALLAPDARLDVYKGAPANFRAWNRQLRQPILLHTSNAVIAYAPLPQFLHARNNLDTLGIDEPMSRCRL